MPLAKWGRGVRRVIWVDENGVEHAILLILLGAQAVWDGRVHQTMQSPVPSSSSQMLDPTVVGAASLTHSTLVSVAEMLAPAVTAGVTILPPVMADSGEAPVPDLRADQIVDIGVLATSIADMPAPDVRVVTGIVAEVLTATSDMRAPTVFADATISPPVMAAFADLFVPTVGSFAVIQLPEMSGVAGLAVPAIVSQPPDVLPPALTATATMLVPAVQAQPLDVPPLAASATADMMVPTVAASALVAAPVMTSTGTAPIHAISADSSIAPPAMTSGAEHPSPTVTGSGVAHQRMDKSGTYTAAGGNNWALATGWVSNVSYPCTIVSSRMQVAGAGTVTLAWKLTSNSDLRIAIGATVLATPTSGVAGSTTITVANGDQIEVAVLQQFFPNSTVSAGFVEIY